MKRATETRVKPRSLVIMSMALAALASCDEALPPDVSLEETQVSETDNDGPVELFPDLAAGTGDSVEAPEAFQVTEAGLWDGRPSLGGIWVAHPDVTQPERVVIKNPKNKKSITGALFRRERNLPGPALQLSSAAAEQLGILAGSPTQVQVVALRRKPVEKKEAEPETEIANADETPAADQAKPQDAETDTAAVDAEKPTRRKWWQKKETTAAAGAAGVAAVAADAADDAADDIEKADETPAPEEAKPQETATDTASADAEKPARRKWWQKKEPTAAAGAAGAAAVAADATTEAAEEVVETAALATPEPNLSDPTVTPPAEEPQKRKWWQKKNPDEITETPLDPIEGAAAAIEAAEPTSASATTETRAASGSISKPFVQVGTFTVEANAKSAAAKIKRNGMPAEVRELKSDGKTVWRVVVGPASTRAERNAMQSDVKDLGFTDAFSVKN